MKTKLRNLSDGRFFVLQEEELKDLRKATVYMRASGIPDYPTSVAQIIHCPTDPASCGTGAFPGRVALHSDVFTVELSQVKSVVSCKVYAELRRALRTA